MTGTSDGSTASYYELPKGCTELQDLISHRNLNAQDGEMFRAIYRKGLASHSDTMRDAKKVLFYAHAEVERLEQFNRKNNEQRNSRLKNTASVSADHFDESLSSYIAAARHMVEDFGQQNQLMGGAMIKCPGCSAEHCPCVAK
jgi:hypothetical protein